MSVMLEWVVCLFVLTGSESHYCKAGILIDRIPKE